MTDALRAAARQCLTDLYAGLPPDQVLRSLLKALVAEEPRQPGHEDQA